MNKQIIIAAIESGYLELETTVRAVPADKAEWEPLGMGRSVLELLSDAAQTPALCRGVLEGTLEFGPEVFQKLAFERAEWTWDEAMYRLRENTRLLIETIEKMPDELLDEPAPLPMGGGMTMPLGAWILMAYRSFMTRTGQINYIQTLYGDFETHWNFTG